MQKPSIGRIVHYVNHSGQHLAAIVTKVNDSTVHLGVFDDAYVVIKYVDYDESTGINTWHWPEREG